VVLSQGRASEKTAKSCRYGAAVRSTSAKLTLDRGRPREVLPI
jgi:hypothetical protein